MKTPNRLLKNLHQYIDRGPAGPATPSASARTSAHPADPTPGRHPWRAKTVFQQSADVWSRRLLISLALGYLGLFLLLPVLLIFVQATADGYRTYLQVLLDPIARDAISLTLIAAGVAVPVNMVFGAAAAWAIAKFEFMGKSALIALIDMPLTLSPVIGGLIYVLIFGLQGWLGPSLQARHIPVIFAAPGIVLVTLFVTLPFMARELIPLMQERGNDDEEAAVLLGANWWQTFRRVSLPGVKWGVLYGAILSAARAIGEFGAVSVVSGHIRGRTNTMTLHVEALYNEYHITAAFAVASLLALLALATLALQALVERPSRGVCLRTQATNRGERSWE